MNKKTALIIIDIINKMDFKGSEDLLHYTKTIVQPLLTLKQRAKQLDIPVIYVNDNFGLWREDVSQLIEECKRGIGRDLIESFIPEKDDFFILKPKHSGFHGTQLDILLTHLGIENLILTGVAADLCVLFTAFDAHMREYNLWVPDDCTASETVQAYEAALHIMSHSISAKTDSTTEVTGETMFM